MSVLVDGVGVHELPAVLGDVVALRGVEGFVSRAACHGVDELSDDADCELRPANRQRARPEGFMTITAAIRAEPPFFFFYLLNIAIVIILFTVLFPFII